MNAISSSTLVAIVLLGQPPGETSESLGQGVLLVDSGKLFEGKIDRVGNLYRVVSGGRSEMVRDVNVSFTGQTKDDAYEFLKSKKKLDTAESAAKLADWCKRYGMPKEAVAEARAAARLAPDDRAVAKLVRDCEEFAKTNRPVVRVIGSGVANNPTPSSGAAPPLTIPAMTESRPVKITSTKLADIEIGFSKSVQPMLMNLCANCHADPMRNVAFRLTRIPEGILVSPKTAENVAATMPYLRKDQPLSSPLITFAITPHGGKTASPMMRPSTASKNLEAWVVAAAATIPDSPALVKTIVVVGAATPEVISPKPVEPQPLPTLPVTPTAPQAVPAKPVDPFDPADFNKATNGPKKPS